MAEKPKAAYFVVTIVSLSFLPLDYNLCGLLYASATEFYDWRMRETPNTAISAACIPTMPLF
jgi:hypothetical protein